MVYNLLINGVYWGYNPVKNHLLSSWDIQVTITFPKPPKDGKMVAASEMTGTRLFNVSAEQLQVLGRRWVAYKMPWKWHAMLAKSQKIHVCHACYYVRCVLLYYLFTFTSRNINRMQAEHTWMLYCLGKSWRLFALLTYLLSALKKPSFGFGFSGLLFLWYFKGIIVWTTAK